MSDLESTYTLKAQIEETGLQNEYYKRIIVPKSKEDKKIEIEMKSKTASRTISEMEVLSEKLQGKKHKICYEKDG
jgi:hypothetical protein